MKASAACTECDYKHSEAGHADDGTWIQRVEGVAQVHANRTKHVVEFTRHEHAPRMVKPGKHSKDFDGAGLVDDNPLQTLELNPLNDSYV